MMAGCKKTVTCQLLWLLVCIEGFRAFQFRRSLLCESLTGFLTCLRPDDYVVVKRAVYGRRLPYPRVCGDLTGRPPCSMDSTATLLPFCYRRQNCTFPNTDTFHGQPCQVARQGKYLSFNVACIPQEAIYPVCGTTSSNTPVPLPLPEQGLLAPPFYTPRKVRPWRCDVKISGAASMTLEVINDDNGRVPVMACGRNIYVGDLRSSPGCRPLSKDQNYTTKGDVNIYFYNTNDTGPQALVYYQVIQKDVLSILTASRRVHPLPIVEPSTIFPLMPETSTQEYNENTGTAVSVTEGAMGDDTTSIPTTDNVFNMTSTENPDFATTDDMDGIFCNTSANDAASNATDDVSITCLYVTAQAAVTTVSATDAIDSNETDSVSTEANIKMDFTTAGLTEDKTEPPKIISGNKIPVNTSSNTSPAESKSSAIPAYLVGIIVGVLGFIILLLIVAFIVAVCKRRDRASRADDMTALSQDRDGSREMNIYATIDLQDDTTAGRSGTFIKSKKSQEKGNQDTIEKAKAGAKDKTNSTFNPSEIWNYDDSLPTFYFTKRDGQENTET